MSHLNLLAIRAKRVPWNKGRIIGQRRPLLPKHVWAIRVRLELAGKLRDLLALFNMAIDSKLMGCDLVRLHVADVYSAGQVKERASILQSKTRQPVRFEITEGTRASLRAWLDVLEHRSAEFLWPGRLHDRPHIGTRQYARLVHEWVASIGLEPSAYGTHSMRRTKVAQIYRKTGNLRAVQLLLGHTKMDSTVRYFGVDLEDALTISEGWRSEPAVILRGAPRTILGEPGLKELARTLKKLWTFSLGSAYFSQRASALGSPLPSRRSERQGFDL